MNKRKKNHNKLFEIIKEEINSFLTELNLYHASKSDFNRFNHKKYLSSGAGSQAFGWGTYLTDSFPIAKDYAEKFINLQFNQFVMSANPSDYIDFSEYDDDIKLKVTSFYRQYVSLGMVNDATGRWDKHSFDNCVTISDENPSDAYDRIVQEYESQKQFMINFCDQVGLEFNIDEFNTQVTGYKEAWMYDKNGYIKMVEKENLAKSLFKQLINDVWDDALAKAMNESYIYEVSIPDDDGTNYIHYDEYVSDDIMKRIENGFNMLSKRFNRPYLEAWQNVVQDVLNMINHLYGKSVLYCIEKVFEDFKDMEKAKSLFLLQCGFVGMKYRAGTMWGLPKGADENSMNYVIFNANDIKITSKNIFRQ